MLRNPRFVLEDVEAVKALIRESPWASIVAHTERGMVASHYPVLLDESDESITLVGHVGRPDEELLELGHGEILVIIQGPHGYVSPSWYPPGQFIPTWNHVTAHLWGVPQILDEAENFEVLRRMVDHFESRVAGGRSLNDDEATARSVARGTVGFKVHVTRFEALAKLSQNKPMAVRASVAEHLRAEGPYRNEALADVMDDTLDSAC